jgi:hypothetical protein
LRRQPTERRAAPRYSTYLEKALPVHVHLLGQKSGSAGESRSLGRVVGYTRDVSESGLGLVVPDLRIAGRNIVNAERLLLVIVGLPAGPVEMRAAGVRHVEMEKGNPEAGYLVGIQIREMAPADRSRYKKFINSLAVGDV